MFSFLLDSAANDSQSAGPASFLSSPWVLIAIYALFFVAIYFLMIRPQKKKQKEQEKMQASVQNGTWILLNNGMYGKVVNLVNDCVIVELGTNKSVMVPVLRNQIAAICEPDLTPHAVDEAAVAPTNAVVGNDLPKTEAKDDSKAGDGLDAYDRYLIEQADKKNKKKNKTKF